jgi:hypothetical protein
VNIQNILQTGKVATFSKKDLQILKIKSSPYPTSHALKRGSFPGFKSHYEKGANILFAP